MWIEMRSRSPSRLVSAIDDQTWQRGNAAETETPR